MRNFRLQNVNEGIPSNTEEGMRNPYQIPTGMIPKGEDGLGPIGITAVKVSNFKHDIIIF